MTGILDAPILRQAMTLYAEALRRHRDEINSLNVFPVPDGDTGTNMLLTQEAVERELAALDGQASTIGALGQAISRASLMGARGNSGVILSQILRGLCERLPGEGAVGPKDLSAALTHASAEADRAVARPADGTVLSVLRDAARAAEAAAGEAANCADVVDAVLDEARRSLAGTRTVLPELRSAGVVDAGAKGLVLLFDALHAALRDEALSEPAEAPGPVGRVAEGPSGAGDLRFAHEVQFLVEADDGAVGELRRRLEPLGDSLVIVGGGGMYHAHLHTDEPDHALEAAREAGTVMDVSIVDLRGQVTDCIAGQARAVRVAEQTTGLVAVAEGDGLARTLRSLGAVVVPAADEALRVTDLLTAIEAAPAESVVLLTTAHGGGPAAERAVTESPKSLRVVRSGSVPAGLAAAAAFNPLLPIEENAEAMAAAAAACRSGEVVAEGDDAEGVAVRLAVSLAAGDAEIITVIAGADASDESARVVARAIGEAVPGAVVEVIDGGQPGSLYLIGVE